MLTPWNRKELVITYSIEEESRIRDLLAAGGIDYGVKVVNRNSPSAFSDARRDTGTFGQRSQLAYEYLFYVHKKDYDQAKGAIG